MADDFRQNPQRERAVTDSILRPPAREPFDLLDEAIRSVPQMIEGRRAEEAEADLRRELQEADAGLQRELLGARLTAEEASELRTQLQTSLDRMLEMRSRIDWSDPNLAEQQSILDAAIEDAEAQLASLAQAYTPETIQTGSAGERIGAAGQSAVGASRVLADVGGLALQADRAEEDRVAARDQSYVMEIEGFRARNQRELTELNQEWQSIENSLDRDDAQKARDQQELLTRWMRGLDTEDMRWAEEFRGELQRDLQSNQFDHEAQMFELQSELQTELVRMNQIFEGDQADLDRQLNRDLTSWQINSTQEIAALDRAVRQYEAENTVRLQEGHLALAERKAEFDELNSARDTYISLLDDYEGVPSTPESEQAIERIMLAAESSLGPDSSQFLQVRGRADTLDSPWAQNRYSRDAESAEQSRLKTNADRIANELSTELVTAQELANWQSRFENSQAHKNAAITSAKDATLFITTAVEQGDLVGLDMMRARAENDPYLAEFFSGVDWDQWREEAKNVNEFNRDTFKWAREERDMAMERHAQAMSTGEVTLFQSRANTAQDLALAAPRNPEEYEAWLNGVRNNPSFEELGGEAFVNQLEAEINHNRYVENREQRERAASAYLANPQPTPEWAAGAANMLHEVFGMTTDEAALVAGDMQEDGWYSHQHRALDLGLKLNEWATSDLELEGMQAGPLPSAIEVSEMRMLIKDQFEADMAAAAEQYQGCAVSSDPLSAQQMGLSCNPKQRQAYDELVNEASVRNNMLLTALVRGETIDGFAMLRGFADATASEGVGGVGGDIWNESMTPEAETALAREFETIYEYPTQDTMLPGESTGQLEGRQAAWMRAFEDYKLAVAFGGSFEAYDYGTGENVSVSSEEIVSLQERLLDNELGGEVAWRDDPERTTGELVLDWIFGGRSLASMGTERTDPGPFRQRLYDIILGGGRAASEAAESLLEDSMEDAPPNPSGPVNDPGGDGTGGGTSGARGGVTQNVASAMGHFREAGLGFLDPREALGDDYAAAAARSPTIRHNNPGALMFAGQAGAVGAREHTGDPDVRNWAHFDSMEDGFQAVLNQQVLYAENRSAATRNLGRPPTIAEMVDIYAPPNENSAASRSGYVNRILRNLNDAGVPATGDTSLKDITDDPGALVALGLAMASFEMGENFSRVFVPGQVVAGTGPNLPGSLFPPGYQGGN